MRGFQKGHPKVGGRKKGTKNKNYLDVNFWAKELFEVMDKMDDKERTEQIKWLLGVLFSKVQAIPLTPTQSVENVNEMLNTLETNQKPANELNV